MLSSGKASSYLPRSLSLSLTQQRFFFMERRRKKFLLSDIVALQLKPGRAEYRGTRRILQRPPDPPALPPSFPSLPSPPLPVTQTRTYASAVSAPIHRTGILYGRPVDQRHHVLLGRLPLQQQQSLVPLAPASPPPPPQFRPTSPT